MTRYVLIADDDPDVQMLIQDILDSMDVTWRSAKDGREALAMARMEIPAALVLDLMMPQVDGYAVLAEMQTDPALQGVPVIVMSAYIEEHEYSLENEPGVVGVLSKGKPSASKLREMLAHALSA